MSSVFQQCSPLWSLELYALGVPCIWTVWVLLLWEADYCEQSGPTCEFWANVSSAAPSVCCTHRMLIYGGDWATALETSVTERFALFTFPGAESMPWHAAPRGSTRSSQEARGKHRPQPLLVSTGKARQSGVSSLGLASLNNSCGLWAVGPSLLSGTWLWFDVGQRRNIDLV